MVQIPIIRIRMSTSEKQAWEAVRKKGKNSFIISGLWRRGFKVAMPFMVGFLLVDINNQHITSAISEIEFLVTGYVILSLAAGWFEGEIVWFKTERNYQRAVFRGRQKLQAGH